MNWKQSRHTPFAGPSPGVPSEPNNFEGLSYIYIKICIRCQFRIERYHLPWNNTTTNNNNITIIIIISIIVMIIIIVVERNIIYGHVERYIPVGAIKRCTVRLSLEAIH